MVTRVYATAAEYEAYRKELALPELDEEQTAKLPGRLRRASQLLEFYLEGYRYRTDSDGFATDPKAREIITEATCDQTAWIIEQGDDTGAAEQFTGGSLGSLSLPRQTGASASRYAPNAQLTLRKLDSTQVGH